MVARSRWVGALLVALVGCGAGERIDVFYCIDADGNPTGRPDCREKSDAGSGCESGEAVHVSLGWEGPTRLWFGPEEQAPECPYGPGSISYEGHADLVAPATCDACTCNPPTGSCALPSVLTASTNICGNFGGGTLTPFNAPTPWDGQCDDTTQLPSGAAVSLTIGALKLTENGCAPGPPVPAKVISASWKTFGRACDGKGWTPGALSQSVCIPSDDPTPSDFRLCIFHDEEIDCPAEASNVFTEQHVFYKGVDDTRECSACSCGAPTGSACTASVSVYKGADLTCSGPTVVKLLTSSASTTCVDVQLPGQALGSKSASSTTYLPGTCEPIGGQPSGHAVGIHASTLCCRP